MYNRWLYNSIAVWLWHNRGNSIPAHLPFVFIAPHPIRDHDLLGKQYKLTYLLNEVNNVLCTAVWSWLTVVTTQPGGGAVGMELKLLVQFFFYMECRIILRLTDTRCWFAAKLFLAFHLQNE